MDNYYFKCKKCQQIKSVELTADELRQAQAYLGHWTNDSIDDTFPNSTNETKIIISKKICLDCQNKKGV